MIVLSRHCMYSVSNRYATCPTAFSRISFTIVMTSPINFVGVFDMATIHEIIDCECVSTPRVAKNLSDKI